MSSNRIKVAELGGVIAKDLRMYNKRILDGMDEVGEKAIIQLVKDTRATAPVGKRKKHYRDSIKGKGIRNGAGRLFIWYVDGVDYRLSHLLENGHALRDGGRVEGTHFIQKASEPILEQYVKDIEEVIQNG